MDEGISQPGEVIGLVDLHDLISFLILCGMKAEGQVELDFVVS